MCGRYTLTVFQQELAEEFELYELEAAIQYRADAIGGRGARFPERTEGVIW